MCMPNMNGLKVNILPHRCPQPLLPSTCLCIFSCCCRGNGSQYPGGGEGVCWAPPQVLAPPPRMHHSCLLEPRRCSPFILESQKKWLFIRILVWYCSAPHKRCFIVLEASPLSQRETITWNCILRVYNKCHFFLSLPLSVLSGGFGHPTQTALALSGQIVVGVAVLHEALEGLGLLWEHGGEICPLGLQ